MVRNGSATSIEEKQPWDTLPGWTYRWKMIAICIVDDAGLIVREARTVSEPEALVAFFEASGMAIERVGFKL